MSDQTIRDVLIRIGIENGPMKVDTSEAIASIDQLQKHWQGVATQIQGGAVVGSGVQIGGVADSLNTLRSGSSYSQVKPGYSADLENRAQELARQQMSGMSDTQKRTALGKDDRSSPVSDAETKQLLEQLTKDHSAKLTSVYAGSGGIPSLDGGALQKDIDEFKKFNEQQREEARLSEEASQKLEKHAVAAHTATTALMGMTKGAAQMAVASGQLNGNMAEGIVAIEGFSHLAKAGAAMGPIGVALAGLAAGVYAYAKANEYSTRVSQENWSQEARDIQRVLAVRSQYQSIATHGSLQKQQLISGTHELGQANRNIRHSERMGLIASEFNAREDLIPSIREQRRQQAESLLSATDEVENRRRQISELEERESVVKEQRRAIGDRDTRAREIHEAHTNARRRLVLGLNDIKNNPQGIPGIGGLIPKTEGAFTQTQFEAAQEKTIGIRAGKATELEQIKKLDEDINALDIENRDIQKEKARLYAEQYGSLSAAKVAADDLVRSQKDAIKSGQHQFGMQNEGDQIQEMELQRKYERIEEQKRQKAAGKNVNVEEYNIHDIQVGQRTGNIAMKGILEQAEEKAKKAGNKKFQANESTLGAAQKHQEEINKLAGPEMKEAQRGAEEAGKEGFAAAQNAVSTLRQIVELLKDIAGFKAEIDGIKNEFHEHRIMNNF